MIDLEAFFVELGDFAQGGAAVEDEGQRASPAGGGLAAEGARSMKTDGTTEWVALNGQARGHGSRPDGDGVFVNPQNDCEVT